MDLNATENNKKLNALHLATISGMDNSVIFLLSLGINPNIQDHKGYTALHYAVRYGHIRIVKKLLQKGADRNIKDNRNKKTPVMLAKNKPEIMEIFRVKGICEKLFFKPDITQKNFYSNQNMVLFIILHIIIIFLTFFVLMPFFNNTSFSITYLIISFLIFFLYILLCFSNPGIMINKEYKDLLDIVEKGEEADNFCPYCLVKHKYRSKHCLVCENCIEEFDHHCFWVGNCIGKNNYTLFFTFLIYVNLNTLFNLGIICYYLLKEIIYGNKKKEKQNFPEFYLGNINSFIYNKYVRIIISIFIFIICILFFIPLIDLFKIQLSNAIERRRNRIDEEEYEKNRLTEKLDEEDDNIKSDDAKVKSENEIWEDIVYRHSIEANDT
jgi:palmitoyltransferase